MKLYIQTFVCFILGFVLISGCISVQQPFSPYKESTSTFTTTSEVTSPAFTSPATTTIPSPTFTEKTVSTTSNPDFKTKGSVDKTYYYIIDGIPGYIPLNIYTGVNEYIVSFGDIYTHDDYNQIVDNEVQREYITPMVKNIKLAAKNPDDEARIAISLVQHIKYDANALNEIQVNKSESGKYIGRYPYTILSQNWGGICGEKSFLLALLLKDLGYSVVLMEFDDVSHMAVGIKVPSEYSYKNTGYALIESTSPEIPTSYEYSVDGYKTRMSLLTPTKIIKISDGKSFDSVSKEFADAQIQGTIHLSAAEVIAAKDNVTFDIQKLEELKLTVDYWRSHLNFDLQGKPINDNNYLRYLMAVGEYNSYYQYTYLPNYKMLESSYKIFKEVYLPKQKSLNEKYGITSGFNIGL
ncbi:hypothetical protein [Methanoregula sp.]|uniref:hypothetical protein n=1 Tax=Methanoregula sp. TaxID=2052170 RepID=UPI00262F9CDA|nr:hypothetical protein [Methanoregula sp.]MDD5142309.1 hypothetical protein [Methanoregula sp.]